MFQPRDRLEETHHLVGTEHDRQLARLARMRDPLRQVGLAQRDPVEKAYLITRLPQLITAGYKSGTSVYLQRDSRGPQLSAVPERAQRSRVRAAVRYRTGLPRGALPLALA